MRIHRTGSVEAMIGGNQYARTEGFGGDTNNTGSGGSPHGKATPASPVTVSTSPAGSPAASHFGIGDLAGRLGSSSVSPGAAYLGSSGLAHSVLASSSFSSNIHNSRAVLAALRALQDKIRALEVSFFLFWILLMKGKRCSLPVLKSAMLIHESLRLSIS